jgi:hypothetical protein
VTNKVSFSNQGSESVSIAQINIAGQTFFVNGKNDLPVTITPGSTYSFAIGFKPVAVTSYAGTFSAMDSSAQQVAQGSLSGTGVSVAAVNTPTLAVSPGNLSFGDVTVGSSSTLPVTLTSTGTAPVTINSDTLTGAGLTVSGAAFPLTLSPQQTARLEMKFAPTAKGATTGALTISSNSSTNATATISISGMGISTTETTPMLTVSPGSLSFGDVMVGSSSTLPVTLASTGTAPVTIDSDTLTGTGLTVSGATFPLTLSPQQTASLKVKFAPVSKGVVSGVLTINSNSSTNAMTTVNLSGTGEAAVVNTPMLNVSPGSLSFGNVTVGSSSTLPVILASTGTAPVTINSDTLTGAGLTVSGAVLPLTLSPQQTVSLAVKFAPASKGAAAGVLTINSNSSINATATVSLSGTGAAAVAVTSTLTVSPGSLSFGDVTVDSSSTLPVTLTSTGTAPVTINSDTLAGTGLTLSGAAFPVTLNPQLAITLDVSFAPTTTGATTGSLTISSNSSTNPTATVGITGTGQAAATAHGVDLSWNAPSSSPDPVAGYNVYRSPSGSSAYQLLNSSVNSPTTYVDNTVQSGVAYDYIVESVDAAGNESIPSNMVSVTIP